MSALSVSYFTERTERLLEILRHYLSLESPSTNKAAVDRFGSVVAAELR